MSRHVQENVHEDPAQDFNKSTTAWDAEASADVDFAWSCWVPPLSQKSLGCHDIAGVRRFQYHLGRRKRVS